MAMDEGDIRVGRRVRVTEYCDVGVYHRTIVGILGEDKEGLYIDAEGDAEGIHWSFGARAHGVDKEPADPKHIRLGSERYDISLA
ncbi:MAG: hypothetical protein HY367_04340 [Candidatus Aenigmarchaeota archaeon]|nr:hypothetical protein [Candidatus Aenigmarchaeota archaeon]